MRFGFMTAASMTATGVTLALTTGCGPLASVAGEAAKAQPFTVAFGGDVHFEGQLRARLDADPGTAFGPVAERLESADLAMVNLETAVTTGGAPAPKQFVFRAPPAAFQAVRSAGVDVVTMANNHGMDYGEAGLRDSVAAGRQAGLPTVGIGGNATEAYRPYVATVKGNKVAVIGATQVLDDNLIQAWTATDAKAGLASAKDVPRLVRAVRQAGESADIVIVNLHWGQELNSCATPAQRDLAGRLIEAGADAVVGSHAHVLQAGGFRNGKYVHYGLGNFLFYNSSGRTAQSGVLTLTFDGGKVARADWAPAVISGGIPQPLTDAAARQAQSEWEGLRRCADVTAQPAKPSS